MARNERRSNQQELLDEFESVYFQAKENSLGLAMSLERQRKSISFNVPKLDIDGFDVGADVEEYGIYPWAGLWHGMPWEPIRNQWDARDVCVSFFGFVRALLSPVARLRSTYRRSKLKLVEIELLDKNEGWTLFERLRFFTLPYGQLSIAYQQNKLLPAREQHLEDDFAPW